MSLPFRKAYYAKHPLVLWKHAVGSPLRIFWQRGRQGWSTDDTFSIDHYLSRIIPEMLDALRERNLGWPAGLLTQEEWNDILAKIAQGFRSHATAVNMDYLEENEHYDPKKHQPIEKALEKEFQEAMKLFTKWYGHLWD